MRDERSEDCRVVGLKGFVLGWGHGLEYGESVGRKDDGCLVIGFYF